MGIVYITVQCFCPPESSLTYSLYTWDNWPQGSLIPPPRVVHSGKNGIQNPCAAHWGWVHLNYIIQCWCNILKSWDISNEVRWVWPASSMAAWTQIPATKDRLLSQGKKSQRTEKELHMLGSHPGCSMRLQKVRPASEQKIQRQTLCPCKVEGPNSETCLIHTKAARGATSSSEEDPPGYLLVRPVYHCFFCLFIFLSDHHETFMHKIDCPSPAFTAFIK